jgi:hypothetical protein
MRKWEILEVGKELQIWGDGFRCLVDNLCGLRVLCGEILLENGN